MRRITRNYDPTQLRDSDGKWVNVPFDTAGLIDAFDIDGTFGDAMLGLDHAGDVRFAFRELSSGRNHNREFDVDLADVEQLRDSLNELVESRDSLLADADDLDPRGLYDDRAWGPNDENLVELYGNGQIVVTIGHADDDPWQLRLDPPYEADPDDPDDEDSDDTQALLDAIDELWERADIEGHLVDDEPEGDAVGRASIVRKFDPSQPRIRGGEDSGQWVSTGALKDALKVNNRINLRPGERLLGSSRVDGDAGGIRTALTISSDGRRLLRFGAGGEGYGRADRDEGIAAWDGNPSTAPLAPEERQRLEAEDDALSDESFDATPEREAEIEARRYEIRELTGSDDRGFNGTANLDEFAWRRLADRIRPALVEAVEQEKRQNTAWDEIEALEAKGDFDPSRMAELRRIARADETNTITFDEGIVAGSEWGDVHFSVSLDDPSVGAEVSIGVTPKGAPDDWGDDKDWQAKLDAAETRRLLRQLDQISSDTQRSYSPENGPPAGGQFAPGGGRVGGGGKKPSGRRPRAKPAAPAGPLSFDGETGSGYGIKGGDPRVRTLQAALTRLGVTDSDGKGLAPDGKYGPKTTSAVKKLQKALGVEADGKVTPELLKQVTDLKQLPPAKPRAPRKRPKTTRRSLLATVNRALRLGVEVRHQQLFDRTYVLDDIQISRSGDGRTVEAYAAIFQAPYEVSDQHGHYMEVIDRAAFDRTLKSGAGQNAMCLYNHGMSVVDGKPDSLAQVPIGTPLEIRADGRGLLTVTRYNKSALADSVLEAIRSGSIRSQSFRGRILRSSPDRVPLRSRSGDLPTITRHELGLTDYGPTPIPVNAGAEIMAVRSLTELAQDFAALDDDGRLELLRTLGIDLDGVDIEETQGEAAIEADDTTTSAKSEPGSEDSPAPGHSGRLELQRAALRAELILKGVRRAEAA